MARRLTFAVPRVRRRAVLLTLAATLSAVWIARAGVPPYWAFLVHRSVTRAMTAQKIPGLSVAVVTDGKVRWVSAYGLADVENRVPARPETVYRFASISKPITAVAVMQLAERGAVDLDAPVQTYVPDFPEKPWPITTRQLLSHLAGVRHYQRDEVLSVQRYESLSDALAIFRDDPLVCEPGTRHVYSTYGYNLLGAVVEGATGRRYIDYVARHVFRPAGMERCRDADHDAIIPDRARGYVRDRQGRLSNSRPADLSNKVPGGGLCGTVEDVARFAAAFQAGRLVRPETVRRMTTRQATKDGRPVHYGLGWSLSERPGSRLLEVWHSGHQPQVSNMLYLLPERGVAVVLMCNLEHAQLLDLAREIAGTVAP